MAKRYRITTVAGRSELASRREPYWHQLRKGGYVGLRKFRDGERWLARWRTAEGKQEYKPIGELADYDPKERFDQASKLANEWLDGKSRPDAPRGRPTVKHATEHYQDYLSAEKGPRALADAKMRAKAHILPKLKDVYLDELTTAKLNKWKNAFVPDEGDEETLRRARDTANRHLNTLKAILNRAWQDGLVASDSAWRRVKRFSKTKGKRGEEEALSPEQTGRLLKKSPKRFEELVKGLLLTGLRPGIEIEHIRREQYTVRKTRHGDVAAIEVRESKTGPRVVYLSREARAFFDELAKDKHPKAFLFTRDGKDPWREKEASRAMREIRVLAKLPADTVLYSLRHTYITRALENGANMKLIADNCGTSIRMLEQHYWKAIQARRQEMLDGVSILA